MSTSEKQKDVFAGVKIRTLATGKPTAKKTKTVKLNRNIRVNPHLFARQIAPPVGCSPAKAIKRIKERLFVFSGRATRFEFLIFSLIYLFYLVILLWNMNLAFKVDYTPILSYGIEFFSILSVFCYLILTIADAAICARRLHDMGVSAKVFVFLLFFSGFFLFSLVYVPILHLVLLCVDSQPRTNSWGISEIYPEKNKEADEKVSALHVEPSEIVVQRADMYKSEKLTVRNISLKARKKKFEIAAFISFILFCLCSVAPITTLVILLIAGQ